MIWVIMVKPLIIVFFLCLSFTLLACAPVVTSEHTLETGKTIASNYITNSPTYAFDGK